MFSRINAWILGRLAKPSGGGTQRLVLDKAGLRVSDGTAEAMVPWTEVTRIVAFTRPDEMGGAHCLAVECADGAVLELQDSVTGPDDTIATLGAHLSLEMSPNAWRTRLLAEPSATILVYGRPDSET